MGQYCMGQVTTSKLKDGAVTHAKIADDAIQADKIKDLEIKNADIAADAAIDSSKLSGGDVVITCDANTEEQLEWEYGTILYSGNIVRAGQRLTISNRMVGKLGIWIYKQGSPSGMVTFTIRRVSDDSIIVSKEWGDASALTGGLLYREVEFDCPVCINEEVRISVEFSGGDVNNNIIIYNSDGSVKANELSTYYIAAWTDMENRDCYYRYKYGLKGILS